MLSSSSMPIPISTATNIFSTLVWEIFKVPNLFWSQGSFKITILNHCLGKNQVYLKVTFRESTAANTFPFGLLKPIPPEPQAISSNHAGTSCWALKRKVVLLHMYYCLFKNYFKKLGNERQLTSASTFIRGCAIGLSAWGSKKEIALPILPQRPVRPILWTYSSIVEGRSTFITCWTFSISRPLAATDVATRTGHLPVRK